MPVVRYDTEHGFAHRDLLDKEGIVKSIYFYKNLFFSCI
ncbi:DUF7718 family protein [Candidatus Kuenenia stuttgartiensis]